MYSEQIQRIKKKLVEAKHIDTDFRVFGASGHRYELNIPATLEEVEAFEKAYEVQLPECYRSFVLHVGNGGTSYQGSGAGPFYGIYPLGEHLDDLISGNPEVVLRKKCCLHPKMDDIAWETLTKVLEDDNLSDEEYYNEMDKIYGGILALGSQGCAYVHALVLNGPYKGNVLNLEMSADQTPKFAHEKNFLDWYERWLDEIISGKLITKSPTWFGYTPPE